jgi:CheY-specific phosphatase CheX
MDQERSLEILASSVETCAIELFRDAGAEFGRAPVADWLPDLTSVIGFAGHGVAGALALWASNGSIAFLAEVAHAQSAEDWLGELSNQLLGRIKRKLAPYGAVFDLGTPVVVAGEKLRVMSHRPTAAVRIPLTSAAGNVEVSFEMEFRDGFQLSDEPAEDEALAEGEALLF